MFPSKGQWDPKGQWSRFWLQLEEGLEWGGSKQKDQETTIVVGWQAGGWTRGARTDGDK